MSLITAQTVREHVAAIGEWSPSRAIREAQQFTNRQPVVNAYVLGTLEEEGHNVTSFALQMALTIDAVYRSALCHTPRRITARVMDDAVAEAAQGFERLVGVEPEFALRRLLFQRDMAEPDLLVELLRLLFEEVGTDAELEASVGLLFLAIKAVALAYERANGIGCDDESKGSVGGALEAQLGHPLPKIGRNEPCPCGSGQKFKKCCGQRQAAPDPEIVADPRLALGDSRAERSFLACMELVRGATVYYRVLCEEREGAWLRRENDRFEEDFQPGKPGGVPDSLHFGYLLFDMVLPKAKKSVGQLFLEREGRKLVEPGPSLLRQMCDSYVAFYQLEERVPEDGTKRLRELVSGSEWVVGDVDDPSAGFGDPGEIWLCRFIGPRTDAFTFSSPLVFGWKARGELENYVRERIGSELAAGKSVADALRLGMKRSGRELADFVLRNQSDEGALTDEAPLWSAEAASPAAQQLPLFDEDAQTRRIIEEFCAEHYRTWPDRPVSALGGETPRHAVQTKAGRKRVLALLDSFEQLNTSRVAGLPAVDVDWLRRELGLER